MEFNIVNELFKLKDEDYLKFNSKLIPGVEKEKFIGVRTPALRKLAKEIINIDKADTFLKTLPHNYFEENQLHAFIISEIKDFNVCISSLCEFLPYVNNWATCDQMSPKIFKKNRFELLPYIKKWIESDLTFTKRFAVKMLMEHFLDEDFKVEYAVLVSSVRSEDYYVNMMIAWYFATALAKQYDTVISFMENKNLSDWTHNKTIQKCVESYRITPEHKKYLRSLKIKRKK